MISAVIDLPPHKWWWRINLHCAVTCYHTDQIIEELRKIGCPAYYQLKSRELMDTCQLNTGLTFSNPHLRESVVVVALTSCPAEFQNSLQHELSHVVYDIATHDKIKDKEELGYLIGEINLHIFPYVQKLLEDY